MFLTLSEGCTAQMLLNVGVAESGKGKEKRSRSKETKKRRKEREKNVYKKKTEMGDKLMERRWSG